MRLAWIWAAVLPVICLSMDHSSLHANRVQVLDSQRQTVCGPSGPRGYPGPRGEPGARGPDGPVGVQGPEGPLGVQGRPGPFGQRGPRGRTGAAGDVGEPGAEGMSGRVGDRGYTGVKGIQGQVGVKGARGSHGDIGARGSVGDVGPAGHRGNPGKPGKTGVNGPTGIRGPIGKAGDMGVAGYVGQVGERGPPGATFAYTATGPDGLTVGEGGDEGLMSSGQNKLTLEHSDAPVQIQFVQKKLKEGQSTLPGKIAGFYGNIGVGTETPYKRLHVKDKCIMPDDNDCSERHGQIALDSPFRNALMVQNRDVHYDLIASYPQWSQGKPRVYIGAVDEHAYPRTESPQKVYFGGVSKGMAAPRVKVDLSDGKIYASKFKVKAESSRVQTVLSDVDSFLETDDSSKDISDILIALHAKTSTHNKLLGDIRRQAFELHEMMDSSL